MMNAADKTVEELVKMGYRAKKENDLVCVETCDPSFTCEDFAKLLAELGYHNSYEIRLSGEAAERHLKNVNVEFYHSNCISKNRTKEKEFKKNVEKEKVVEVEPDGIFEQMQMSFL